MAPTIQEKLSTLVDKLHTVVTIKLDSGNYSSWQLQIEGYLTANDFFEYVDDTNTCPPSTLTTAATTSDDAATAAAAATTVRSLNDLPEHLLLDIISYLPTINAIQTSSISRRWRNLWSFTPSLFFSYDLFPPSSDNSPAATRRRFVDSVNQTLILRHPQSPPLTTFRLRFDFKEYEHSYLIESWIHYAVTRGVRNLDIDFYIDRKYHIDLLDEEQEPYFQFPFHVLRKGKVRVLKLSYCELILPADINSSGGVKFDSIRSLFLDQVDLMGHSVSDLMNGCSNLETLSLQSCWGLENAEIHGMKIKKLSLGYFHCMEDSDTSIEIDCPNLRVLDICLYEVGKYILKNASSLVEASVNFAHREEYYVFWSKVVRLLGHVRKLTVQNWWFKLLQPKDSVSLKFHNLTWLELQTTYLKSELLGIAALLELCPNLDTLVLVYLFEIKEEEESLSEELLNKRINLTLPRLRQAKMKCYTGTKNENLLVKLLMKHATVCQKIVLVPIEFDDLVLLPMVFCRRPNGA